MFTPIVPGFAIHKLGHLAKVLQLHEPQSLSWRNLESLPLPEAHCEDEEACSRSWHEGRRGRRPNVHAQCREEEGGRYGDAMCGHSDRLTDGIRRKGEELPVEPDCSWEQGPYFLVSSEERCRYISGRQSSVPLDTNDELNTKDMNPEFCFSLHTTL